MAVRRDNKFTSYEFTPDEEINAQKLTSLQTQYYQTQLANVVEDLLALELSSIAKDPDRDFAIQHAYLKGQESIYALILASSEIAEQEEREENDRQAKLGLLAKRYERLNPQNKSM